MGKKKKNYMCGLFPVAAPSSREYVVDAVDLVVGTHRCWIRRVFYDPHEEVAYDSENKLRRIPDND